MSEPALTARLAELPSLPTPELKTMWLGLFGRPAPPFNRAYLVSPLAYRLQELSVGGLRPSVRARLDVLADGLDPKAARRRIADRPVAGTRLVRDWQGVEHSVTVTVDGFTYQ